ncbi:uncharacterized protein [Panulirus ornatus]|uniref:uncharacterized protein isoform X5 n=1 Tax=Panulirus ornatus TaxID=150431 RepID=UPI003A8AD137
MKLRYDFDSSQKTYRTFPQKVAHSTGLADRWSILRWCCPFCLDKPRSRSRKSSGVPVIRITRPRSPDSDQDSEDESERRRNSVGSGGSGGRTRGMEPVVTCPTGSNWASDSGDVLSQDSSIGSGELDVIDEEYYDRRGDDTDSILSEDSVRSKGKSSVKSKSSVSGSVKSKESGKGKMSKMSKKNSKESFRNSRDSVKDKEGDKDRTRSPVKKILKHLKRSTSSGSSSSASGRGGNKRSSSKSKSSVVDDDGPVSQETKTFSSSSSSSFSSAAAQDDRKRKSMTLDGLGRTSRRGFESQGSATSEVIGHDVMVKGNKSATIDGRRVSGMKETSVTSSAAGEEDVKERTYTSSSKWQVKTDEAGQGNHLQQTQGANDVDDNPEEEDNTSSSKCDDGDTSREGNSTPQTSPEKVMQEEIIYRSVEEVTFKSPKTIGRGEKSVRNKEMEDMSQDGVKEGRVGGEVGNGSCPAETPPQKDKVYDSASCKQHHQAAPPGDESTGCAEEGVGLGHKSGSPSPLVGSVGRISGRDSIASLASSTDTSCLTHPDDDIERLLQLSEKKTSSLTPLGSRSESMASVCSAGAEGRYGTVTIKGEIELGLQYNYKEGQLECRVVQCRDLAAVDNKRNRSDPYVKVYLLPDKSKSGKRKTKVKKHTLNPVFEEVLRFSTTMSELDSRTLWVSVWHSDMFGRNDFLGEVIISLTDTVFDDVTPRWYPLQDRMEPMEDLSYSPRGDLILALKFVPPDAVSTKKSRRSRGALHVLVKEAKSLAAARPHGTADPICKGLLLPEKGKASKQKTSVCRKTLNPTWNHTLVFEDTSLQELTERALELSVWDHDRLGPSQFLGGCRLNLGKGKHGGRPVEWMEAAGMEVKLWEQMLERPNLWVEGSIMLRPAMDKPIYSSSMTE